MKIQLFTTVICAAFAMAIGTDVFHASASTDSVGDVDSAWRRKKKNDKSDNDKPTDRPLPTRHGASMRAIISVKNLIQEPGGEDDQHADIFPQYFVDAYNKVKVKAAGGDYEYSMDSFVLDREIDIKRGDLNEGQRALRGSLEVDWHLMDAWMWGHYFVQWICWYCTPQHQRDPTGDDWWDDYAGPHGDWHHGNDDDRWDNLGATTGFDPLDFLIAMHANIDAGALGEALGKVKSYNEAVQDSLCENLRNSGVAAYKYVSECEISYIISHKGQETMIAE